MSLNLWHQRLQDIHTAIHDFHIQSPQLPIIDIAPPDREPLPGLRFLRDEVKRDCDVLAKVLRSPSALSTNAPYLIAVWDELVHARHPVAIYRMFSPRGGTPQQRQNPSRAVKVDVVAENGARWVRINTINNARLKFEFLEMDSYLTSDDEDERRPCLAQTEFDNSVLRMGRELLAAAKANAISAPNATPITPQVTLRLTRLDPSLSDDPRIEKITQCLRDMGIDVQLGERSPPPPVPTSTTPTIKLLEPTTNINLDLSALIALISDITHSPLPRTEQEAHARFEPPQSYLDWKRVRVKSLARQNQSTHPSLSDAVDDESDEGTWENSGQHSRALAAQVIQEMSKGILQEIRERMAAVGTTNVTFWATSEARRRCLQIVSKIGGDRERQRADALLGSARCSRMPPVPAPAYMRPNDGARTSGVQVPPADAYWEHSRYPAGFLPLVPVRVYPSTLPAAEDAKEQSNTTFFDALEWTCSGILSHEAALSIPSDSLPTAEEEPEEIPPAAQTALPKLTVHTVTSMLAGASRGYTTLTTNRSSVRTVLKEMRRVCGRGCEAEMGEVEKAAVWVLDPRSLSEGMRNGDVRVV